MLKDYSSPCNATRQILFLDATQYPIDWCWHAHLMIGGGKDVGQCYRCGEVKNFKTHKIIRSKWWRKNPQYLKK